MSGTSFDRIAQEVLKQQQLMGELEAENRKLRRQLDDLRAGRGIFIEIAGQRFPLEGEMLLLEPATPSTEVQEDLPKPRTTISLQETFSPAIIEDEEIEEAIPISESATSESAPGEIVVREEEKIEKQKVPTFLEEILLDQFAEAATSPLAVWKSPVNKQETDSTDEERKAALRRELMDSFLLE